MGFARRALRLVGAAAAALLLLAALAFALVQTPPGRSLLASALSNALSDPEERITITGLAGFVPFDMTAQRIEIADAHGPRLVVAEAALAVVPANLLGGELTLRRLSAREVEVLRPGAGGSTDPAALLRPPLTVRLEHGQIDRLVLGAAFTGQPVVATLSASGRLGGGQAAADLDLHRIDATPGSVKLNLALSGTPLRLSLAGEIEEPSGRLLAGLLGQTEPLPLTLHVAGEGEIDNWHGTLGARAGSEATLDADVTIAGKRVAANGNARVAALLPPAVRQLVGEPVTFAGTLDFAGDSLALQRLSLATPRDKLDAHGRFDRKTEMLAGEAEAELQDLGDLAALLGVTSGGSARLSAMLGGTLKAPVARLTLAGERLALAGNRLAAAHATIDLRIAGDALDPASPIDVSASGDAAGLALATTSLPGRLGERLDWRLAGQIERATPRLDLHELTVNDGGDSVSVEAAGTAERIAGEATLTVADIARFAGADRHGAVALAADFHAAKDGSAVAVLHGTVRGAQSGTDALDRLLGGEAQIAGKIERSADGALSASELGVTGAELTLTGAAQQTGDGHVTADYRLSLARLAALAPDLAGSATLAGTASGSLAMLATSATLSVEGLRAGAARLDRLEARLDVPDLARRAGHLDATFRAPGIDGTAGVDGLLDGTVLRLGHIRLAAAGARLDGDLNLHLDPLALDGALNGAAPDLKPWSTLAGTPLAGRAELKARFAAAKGQDVELRIDGTALSLGGATLRKVQATAKLANVLAEPAGRAELQIDGVTLGPASVTTLRLTGDSSRPGRFALSAEARGRLRENFALTAQANANLDRDDLELRLTRLTGSLGTLPVSLHQPLLLKRREEGLAFADLDLGFGSGRVTGAGSLDTKALTLQLRAKDLPVHALAELGGQADVSGVLGFEAKVSGSRERPEGELVIDGEELRFAAASRPDLPPLGLVVSAQWHQGEARLRGRLSGPQNAALGFVGSVPLALEPQRLVVHLPPQGALTLRLEGDGELANLADLLPLGEDRLGGRFTIDVSVAGTVAAPRASGRLSVRDGRYESLFWGTALHDVAFDLVGDRDRLVLQNFHGGDGSKGSLALSGSVDLAAAAGPAFNIVGQFQQFRAVQRDEATATMSGDVRVDGDIIAPRLGARLRIDQADLRVPERLPQTMQPIPVTMIDSATGEVIAAPDQSPQKVSLLALALDVAVDMPGQVFVRGRGLDSEWRGHLQVTGTTAQPMIDGKLAVVRGTYDFLGKSAVLNRGVITFLGGKRIDPDIDIEAQVASTDVVAIIDITGTATQPTIKVSSQPALPQDEILARVLFGTSLSQISPAQGLAIAQAATELATGGGPGVLDRLRQGLGLDRLSFGSSTATSSLGAIAMPSTPAGVPSAFPTAGIGSAPSPIGAASSAGGAAAGTVSAGKYVANGVYVGVTQGLSASSSSVDVQIDVTRHISIDTTAGQTAGTGVGVNWKLDY